jgi:apolipoprotein D and lipocalin family protein
VEFSTTLNIKGNYWVFRLDDKYSYAVVGSPNYTYLWILTRAKKISEELYTTLYNDLKKDGFHVEKLKRVVQQ